MQKLRNEEGFGSTVSTVAQRLQMKGVQSSNVQFNLLRQLEESDYFCDSQHRSSMITQAETLSDHCQGEVDLIVMILITSTIPSVCNSLTINT